MPLIQWDLKKQITIIRELEWKVKYVALLAKLLLLLLLLLMYLINVSYCHPYFLCVSDVCWNNNSTIVSMAFNSAALTQSVFHLCHISLSGCTVSVIFHPAIIRSMYIPMPRLGGTTWWHALSVFLISPCIYVVVFLGFFSSEYQLSYQNYCNYI